MTRIPSAFVKLASATASVTEGLHDLAQATDALHITFTHSKTAFRHVWRFGRRPVTQRHRRLCARSGHRPNLLSRRCMRCGVCL